VILSRRIPSAKGLLQIFPKQTIKIFISANIVSVINDLVNRIEPKFG